MAKPKTMLGALSHEILRIVLPLVILGGGVAAFLVLYLQNEAPARVVDEPKPPLVQTVPAEAHDRGLEIEVDGVVVPYREIDLSTEVDGRIEYKNEVCRAGNYVDKDTLLVKIDARDYELEIRRLIGGFGSGAGTLEEIDARRADPKSLIGLAERELLLREKELDRLKGLAGRQVVSEAEIDRAELSVIVVENALQTLRSQLEKTKLDWERTEVHAPIEGVVVDDPVEQGDFVRRGAPLVTIEDTSKVEVKCSLRVDELYWLWDQAALGPGSTSADQPRREYQIPNVRATVVYRLTGQQYRWEGVLSRYEGIGLDETTRTVPCRVVVDRPRDASAVAQGPPVLGAGPPALVRGMFVTVKIHAEPRATLLSVPEKAVRPGSRLWAVRRQNGRKELEQLGVRVLQVDDAAAIVVAAKLGADARGLEAGDRIVVTPLSNAENGMIVREQSVR